MKYLRVVSYCMLPMINKGDVVIVDTAVVKFEVGDIVCIKAKRDYLVHRIYEINDHYIFHSGDMNISLRNHHENGIVGRVVGILKVSQICILTSSRTSSVLAHIFLRTFNINPILKRGIARSLTRITPIWIKTLVFFINLKVKINKLISILTVFQKY